MELHRFPPNTEADRGTERTVDTEPALSTSSSTAYVRATERALDPAGDSELCAAPRMWRGQPTKDRCHLAPGHHGPHQIGDEDFALVGWTAQADRHDDIELATAI